MQVQNVRSPRSKTRAFVIAALNGLSLCRSAWRALATRVRGHELLLGLGLCCALQAWQTCAPQRAAAQVAYGVLAADGNLTLPVKSSYAQGAAGFGVRLGSRFGLPSAQETLEAGFDYETFGASASNTLGGGATAYRGIVGMRLGLDSVLRPGLFAHLGLGHVNGQIEAPSATNSRNLEVLTHTAFTWDAGVYLDLALASFFELGVQFSYNQIFKTDTARSFQWLLLGAHLQFVM
jgi:hypothetical protein